ncbi:CehA/McbA family metallohydrolase [Paenibacillus aestuarii]|uniref:CehA/McbA family metallohydrolase n=1 Tax=Paenibacillus aestuarii TaxID=516965 RepID=A0ABW0KF03_9BACL|nr:CehA/McbA family metallohydrolase [Paenibacillus aestuarii]
MSELNQEERAGLRWLACELHTHTQHSDGRHTLLELARSASDLELDCIALTDHNTTSGLLGKEAVEQETGIRIMNGLEWTTFYGHMLVLGFAAGNYADWRDFGPQDLAKGLREVRAIGALAGLAHPYRVGSPMCTGCYWEYEIADWRDIQFIEVWSGTFPSVSSSNQRAFALWTDVLNQGYRMAATCGRDWHASGSEQEPIAVTYTSGTDPFQAIAAGAVSVSMGPLLTMEASVGEGRVYLLGQTVTVTDVSTEVEIAVQLDPDRRKAKWTLPEQTLEVKLVGNPGIVETIQLPLGARQASVTIAVKDVTWLRAELYGVFNGCRTMIAFTNPIYFTNGD